MLQVHIHFTKLTGLFPDLSIKLIFYVFKSAFLLTLYGQRCSLMSSCINDNEQQMFSVLAGYWQHVSCSEVGEI